MKKLNIKTKPDFSSRIVQLMFVITFAVIGVIVLVTTHAANSTASFSPNQGVLAGNIQTVADSQAFNGTAVQFGSPSTTTVTLPSPGTWTNITGNLSGMLSECGDFALFPPPPNSGKLYASVAQHGDWVSNNGVTWSALGTGSGSDTITNRGSWITYDPLSPSTTFYESGIYNGGGVYKTTDGGVTWKQLGSIGHNDFVSVDYTDPARKTLLAGGHEQSQTVYKSTDGGATWTNIGTNLPAGTGFSSAPMIIDSQTFIISTYPSWGGGTPGIYRTTNGGTSWTKVSSIAGSSVPITDQNGVIYYSDGDGIVKSSDKGLTWKEVGSGLTSEIHPVVLPDNRLVAVGNNNQLKVSSDGGATWTSFGASLPIQTTGLAYSSANKAFYVWHFDCNFTRDTVLPDAVEMLR